MSKWVEGTVVAQKHWTGRLYSLQVEAEIAPFAAGQFTKLALAVEGEMVGRPYSFVNAPSARPHEFYYVVLPDHPLTPRLCRLAAGDSVYLAPQAAGFLTLDAVPAGAHLWLLASGTALGPFLSILGTEAPWRRFERVVLVHDELDIPFADVRLKTGGGEGGHNGLRDASRALGTKDYVRVRVGIGRPPGRTDAADFVLKDFTAAERKDLPWLVDHAADAVEAVVLDGLEAAQLRFHTKA